MHLQAPEVAQPFHFPDCGPCSWRTQGHGRCCVSDGSRWEAGGPRAADARQGLVAHAVEAAQRRHQSAEAAHCRTQRGGRRRKACCCHEHSGRCTSGRACATGTNSCCRCQRSRSRTHRARTLGNSGRSRPVTFPAQHPKFDGEPPAPACIAWSRSPIPCQVASPTSGRRFQGGSSWQCDRQARSVPPFTDRCWQRGVAACTAKPRLDSRTVRVVAPSDASGGAAAPAPRSPIQTPKDAAHNDSSATTRPVDSSEQGGGQPGTALQGGVAAEPRATEQGLRPSEDAATLHDSDPPNSNTPAMNADQASPIVPLTSTPRLADPNEGDAARASAGEEGATTV